MSNETQVNLTFEPYWIGKNGKCKLLAKLGDDTLHYDTLDTGRAIDRKRFIADLTANQPGIDGEAVDAALLKLAADRLKSGDKEPDQPTEITPCQISQRALADTPQPLVEKATKFLRRPDLTEQIVEHVQMMGVAGERELVLMLYLIGTSRLLDKPLAGVVMGASSSGKSYLIRQVAKLFPAESVLDAHRMTPRALEHMSAGSLVHRFVVTGERSRKQDDDQVEATRALREMIGDGKLTLAMVDKNAPGGIQTRIITQDGPIAYVESTTLGIRDIFDEDRTRFVLLSVDERQVQTAAVVKQLAAAASGTADSNVEAVVVLHHTLQRLLRPYEVVVPYANKLITCLPDDRLEVRRTFGHLLSFIQAVALLHQCQREQNVSGQLLATVEDYDMVRQHLSGPLARSLGYALTPGAADLYDMMKPGTVYSIPMLAAQTCAAENTMRSRIKELLHAGQVVKVTEHKGHEPATYRKNEEANSQHPHFELPPLENHDAILCEVVADNT